MQIQSNGFKMNSKEFQRKALEIFTRLEEGQIELNERYVKLEGGYANLNDKMDFVHHDLSTKIEMIADAVKQLVE